MDLFASVESSIVQSNKCDAPFVKTHAEWPELGSPPAHLRLKARLSATVGTSMMHLVNGDRQGRSIREFWKYRYDQRFLASISPIFLHLRKQISMFFIQQITAPPGTTLSPDRINVSFSPLPGPFSIFASR